MDENGKSIESAHFFNFIEGKSFEPRLSEITKSIAIELWGNPYTESTINLYTYKIVGSSVELGDIPVSLDTYFSNNRLSRYKLRHNNIQSKWMIVK